MGRLVDQVPANVLETNKKKGREENKEGEGQRGRLRHRPHYQKASKGALKSEQGSLGSNVPKKMDDADKSRAPKNVNGEAKQKGEGGTLASFFVLKDRKKKGGIPRERAAIMPQVFTD